MKLGLGLRYPVALRLSSLLFPSVRFSQVPEANGGRTFLFFSKIKINLILNLFYLFETTHLLFCITLTPPMLSFFFNSKSGIVL